MPAELTRLFGVVCGQLPAHTWSPGHVLLPMCQRCTGLYAGAAVALLLHAGLRLRPSERFLWLHGGFLLQMVPLGYQWVPQDALLRTLSGILFGAGVTSFLWLTTGPRIAATHAPDRTGWLVYVTGLACALALVPAAAIWGDSRAWYALVILATLGLAGLGFLALGNIVLGSMWLLRRAAPLLRRAVTPAPRDIPASAAVRPAPRRPRGASRPR